MKEQNMVRLIADEGKILTNGDIFGYAIDVLLSEKNNWREVDILELTKNKK